MAENDSVEELAEDPNNEGPNSEDTIDEDELPMELSYLQPGFPRGIYEIETEGTDYELIIDPVFNYMGALIVDQVSGEVDFENRGQKQLSVLSLFAEVGEPARLTLQNRDLEIAIRNTATVRAIRLLKLI